ncbi:2-hydroxychromene-2-carboxylate isomerase [Tsuneonella mangrovi]|uniref:2-hydroxychromene-2-carboxylate isomerase n=1 Tax=Tsuneonella mangrovi TaxID=1982042 RepID=UPI000BA1E38B|nr:2-hydroxychromene-2-carboxylate isomerase [Tsuneonella mangrovi]
MTAKIDFVFDFISPNGYLAWWPLREIAARHGAEIVVIPALLGGMHKLTGNAPPFIRDADIKGKTAYAQLEMQRFIERHGFDKFRMNPAFPFRSVDLLRMLIAAQGQGDATPLIEGLLHALWEDGLDPADSDGVAQVIAASGFDPAELAAKAQDDAVKQTLSDNTANVVERGAFGIPTFYIEGEMFFGKERLGQIDELLASLG